MDWRMFCFSIGLVHVKSCHTQELGEDSTCSVKMKSLAILPIKIKVSTNYVQTVIFQSRERESYKNVVNNLFSLALFIKMGELPRLKFVKGKTNKQK